MSNFLLEVRAEVAATKCNVKLVAKFLSGDRKFHRYVVGKNPQAKALMQLVHIDGLIDDYSIEKKKWNDLEIIASDQIPNNAIIVNCATSISPVSVNNLLLDRKRYHVLNIHEVSQATGNTDLEPTFVTEMKKDFEENLQKWNNIYLLLADDESRKTFFDITCYRLTADPSFMSSYSVRLADQYFEDFMGYANETFADVGGFDGDTALEFCRRYPDYKKILFFEPSHKNMLAAKCRLKKFRNITYFPFGLSNKKETLSFNADNGSASSISNNGKTKIEVDALDRLIEEKVSTIKMDIEGWELMALQGSSDQIKLNKPKLAIAVYHNASDFWKIPEFVLSLSPDYKIYLRHYTEGWSETIMYFLPRKAVTDFGLL